MRTFSFDAVTNLSSIRLRAMTVVAMHPRGSTRARRLRRRPRSPPVHDAPASSRRTWRKTSTRVGGGGARKRVKVIHIDACVAKRGSGLSNSKGACEDDHVRAPRRWRRAPEPWPAWKRGERDDQRRALFAPSTSTQPDWHGGSARIGQAWPPRPVKALPWPCCRCAAAHPSWIATCHRYAGSLARRHKSHAAE